MPLDNEERIAVLETIDDIIKENGIEAKELKGFKTMAVHGITLPAEIEVSFQRGLAGAGDAENFARQLYQDNHTIRENNRELKSKLPEGSIVLTKEQAEELEAYRKFGKPKDIETAVAENGTLKAESASIKRETLLRSVAESPQPGVKFDLDVMKELDAKLPGIEYENKEVLDATSGQKVKKWIAKYKDGETTKEIPVRDLYAEKFPKFMPALEQGSAADIGTFYPEQPGASAPASQVQGNIGQSYAQSRYGHNAPKQAVAAK